MSFIRDYTLYASGVESPAMYHSWCALSALGTFLSRKVWTDMGYFKTYPNMYVMLVGDPGIKKTTAMNIAKDLVIEVGSREIAPASITKEALMQHMGKKDSPCKYVFEIEPQRKKEVSHLSIFASELVTLLTAGGNPIGMIDLLTDIWDRDPYGNVTKNKGSDLIHGPFLHLLGCMTPEVMENMLFQRIISGGFTRRCIFVYADHNERPVPLPEVSPEQQAAWERCVERGRDLLKWQGMYEWDAEFRNELWPAWYNENFRKAEVSDSLVMKGFFRSKPEYVLKLMMLITASETDSLILRPPAFHAALSFLEQIEPNLPRIFEHTGRNELNPIAGAILRKIEAAAEPIRIKRIYTEFIRDATIPEIDSILEQLEKTDKILRSQLIMTGGEIVNIVGLPQVIKDLMQNRSKT